jgi:hypothetical protein
MHSLPALAASLVRFFGEERISYCVLGDTRDFPDSCTGIDLVVDMAGLPLMPATLKTFCARHDCQLATYRRGADDVDCYELSWLDEERRPAFVAVTVRGDFLRCGHLVFTAAEMLGDRIAASDVAGHGRGYFMAAPAREFICHLLSRLDGGALSGRDARHLSEQWRLDSEGVTRQVARFWNVSREGGVVLR